MLLGPLGMLAALLIGAEPEKDPSLEAVDRPTGAGAVRARRPARVSRRAVGRLRPGHGDH